jgi:hypothetical protein
MNKKTIADLVVWIHLIWIALMFLSLPGVLLFPELKIPILIFSVTTVGSWIITRGCPLRSWELNIRNKYNIDGTYQGMFITNYINKHFGTNFSDLTMRLIIYPYMFVVIILALSDKV